MIDLTLCCSSAPACVCVCFGICVYINNRRARKTTTATNNMCVCLCVCACICGCTDACGCVECSRVVPRELELKPWNGVALSKCLCLRLIFCSMAPHSKALCAVGFSFQPARFAFLLPPFWPCLPCFFLPSVQVFFILRCLCCLPPLFGSFQFQHSLAVHCVLALFDGFDSVTYLVADRWEPFWGSIMKCTSRGMWPRKKNGNKYQIPNPSVTYI